MENSNGGCTDDLANNRQRVTAGLSGQEVTTTYSYDQADRLDGAGAVTVTVDANGNLIRRLGGSVDETYGYDQANRLVSATIVENGTPIATTVMAMAAG